MKRIIILILLALPAVLRATEPDTVATNSRISTVDSIINHASQFLGVNYCRGGVGLSCFDCSGFVQRVYSAYGYQLPHSSAAIAKMGKPIKSKEDILPGDLIYFKGRSTKSKVVGHVGIVVQNDGNSIIFIHAAVNSGISLVELENSAYYRSRYLGACRVIE